AEEITLSTGEGFRRVPLEELGVEVDVSATLREVHRVLDQASSLSRWWSLAHRSREGLVDIPLVYRVDRVKAEGYLAALAPEVYREPKNARLDLMNHERVADVPGAELDARATLDALEESGLTPGMVLSVATRPVRASFTLADMVNIDVSKVLASAETTFSLFGTGAGRAVNIATAAKRLDGWVLAPGETFSFNEVVGPRTLEAGFTYAPEIVDDEMEMGVGGGTCQVSSTLYMAVLEGALDVVERVGHSRPSSYAKLGLDATVSYGKVDLRFRNPFPFPLIIHAFLPKPTVIRIELLGAEPQAKVSYTFAIHRSEEFYRRITYKPHLPPGTIRLHQKGHRGLEVVSRVVTHWNDGRTTERTYFSNYRPVPEVFWVGRDVDESQLPELPEGVTRVQRRNLPRASSSARVEPGFSPSSG
ncbi:MAG: VanW family protein, partial [Myxococcales bacterium]|nr:VanW family protein [Polyangiaceae bacterium]MDW8249823.1 VanW family protein [Myxococcales bacterium]